MDKDSYRAANEFRKRLRQDETLRGHFSNLMKMLRSRRDWSLAKDIEHDPVVLELWGAERAEHVVRNLNRCIKKGSISAENLDRFSRLFGLGNVERFVEECVAWGRREDNQLPPSGERSCLMADSDGTYSLPNGSVIFGQSGQAYKIVRTRKRANSRGISYEARVEGSGKRVFVKSLALTGNDKDQLATRVRSFHEFIAREESTLKRLADEKVKGVARYVDFATADLPLDDRVLKVPHLIQEFIKAAELPEAIAKLEETSSEFHGVTRGELWVKLARQILQILADVHAATVRHGDLHPGNFLLQGEQIYLVDFGESGIIAAESIGREGWALGHEYVAPERRRHPEMPLEATEDVFGAGAVLFWLATGKAPDRERIKDNRGLQEYVHSELRNGKLLEYNAGIGHVICQCLHSRPGDRAAHADEALRTLELFERMESRKDESNVGQPEEETRFLIEQINHLKHQAFKEMIRRDLAHWIRRTRHMLSSNRMEVVGTRQDIVTSLLGFVSNLEEGSLYATATAVGFWDDRNIGRRGRFLLANKMLAENGVRIRRIFVVTKDDLKRDDWADIAAAQQEVVEAVRKQGITTTDNSLIGKGYYVGVLKVDEELKETILQEGYHVGIIRSPSQTLSLTFQENSFQEVRRVYIWDVQGRALVEERLRKFDDWLKKSEPICDYVNARRCIIRKAARQPRRASKQAPVTQLARKK